MEVGLEIKSTKYFFYPEIIMEVAFHRASLLAFSAYLNSFSNEDGKGINLPYMKAAVWTILLVIVQKLRICCK